jgi:hypothetical protein
MRYFLDCEFDGHSGPLLSLALVCDEEPACNLYVVTDTVATDPWVIENVVPILHQHPVLDIDPKNVPHNEVGWWINWFLKGEEDITVIADSPVDIARFCMALSTGEDGEWTSYGLPLIKFEVHNVDAYPTTVVGAIRHNAYWDALALQSRWKK